MEIQKVKDINIFILGMVFMFIFAGFNTMTGIQSIIFKSAMTEDSGGYVEGFNGNGFISSAIVYAVFSISSWICPSLIAYTGPRLAMVLAGFLYIQYLAQLLYPNTYLLYIGSAVVGFGSPVLWTAQGNFISINSDETTISRNSGIVWAMFQASTFFGNIFAYFMFNGEEFISSGVRTIVGIVLLSMTIAGTLSALFLRPTPWVSTQSSNESPASVLKNSASLFLTKDMLLLCITFFYTGLQLSLWSGVFPTCIGFTNSLGENRKALATICMIFIAAGEVLGGSVFGFFGHLTTKWGRNPVVLLGFALSIVSYVLIFLNLPFEAPLGETGTEHTTLIPSNKYLVALAAFVMGLSDSCFNTQIMSLLGGSFKDQSVSAFAIFKFIQSLSAAIAFFYSPYLKLQWQLIILVLFDIIGTLAFCRVEQTQRRFGYEIIE